MHLEHLLLHDNLAVASISERPGTFPFTSFQLTLETVRLGKPCRITTAVSLYKRCANRRQNPEMMKRKGDAENSRG
jgi:hypothetical protein